MDGAETPPRSCVAVAWSFWSSKPAARLLYCEKLDMNVDNSRADFLEVGKGTKTMRFSEIYLLTSLNLDTMFNTFFHPRKMFCKSAEKKHTLRLLNLCFLSFGQKLPSVQLDRNDFHWAKTVTTSWTSTAGRLHGRPNPHQAHCKFKDDQGMGTG